MLLPIHVAAGTGIRVNAEIVYYRADPRYRMNIALTPFYCAIHPTLAELGWWPSAF